MARYFIEVSYKGTFYSGFQKQKNANTIQAEVEKALAIFYRESFELTGSSRTDAGVHAFQNYFHFDAMDRVIDHSSVYHLNAILPRDIVIRQILPVAGGAHCRFDALHREYAYFLYQQKNPFLEDRGYYYPYMLDMALLAQSANELLGHNDFSAFSKRNTQVNNFICTLYESNWENKDGQIIYRIKGNRFLRGMVRGIVGTQLKIGSQKLSIEAFRKVIESRDCTNADFSVPAHGLFLERVTFPLGIFI